MAEVQVGEVPIKEAERVQAVKVAQVVEVVKVVEVVQVAKVQAPFHLYPT